jgi:hypothetical protein
MEDVRLKLQLESIKMIRDWSTWLVGIQVAICGFLWNVLKENPIALMGPTNAVPFSVTGSIIHLAWLAFAASLLVAAFMLIRIPKLVESLQQGADASTSVSELPVRVFGRALALKKLVGLQYAFFLAGALLAAVFTVIR